MIKQNKHFFVIIIIYTLTILILPNFNSAIFVGCNFFSKLLFKKSSFKIIIMRCTEMKTLILILKYKLRNEDWKKAYKISVQC